MAHYISKNVGGKIVKALGLSGVKDFSLHFPLHGVPTIKCEMILSGPQEAAIASVLEAEGVKAGNQEGGPIPPGSGPYIVGEGPAPYVVTKESLEALNASIEKRAIAAIQNERKRGGQLGAPKKPATFWQWLARNFRA